MVLQFAARAAFDRALAFKLKSRIMSKFNPSPKSPGQAKAPIPKDLCIPPFMRLSSKPDGKARICCFTQSVLKDSAKKPLRFGDHSLQEIWNGSHIRIIRQKMLEEKRLSICRACFDEEAAGKESKRLRENRRFLSRSPLGRGESKRRALISKRVQEKRLFFLSAKLRRGGGRAEGFFLPLLSLSPPYSQKENEDNQKGQA